jgi:hypothetical protein
VGGYGFLFRSEFFFRTTQELEYLILLSRKARIFFPEFNIRLYDNNSESDYFFFLHQNQNIFFSNIGNQNIDTGKLSPLSPPDVQGFHVERQSPHYYYKYGSFTVIRERPFNLKGGGLCFFSKNIF